jgi:predicted phosphodiesterase
MRAVLSRGVVVGVLLPLAGCGGGGGGVPPTPVPTPIETPSSSAYLQDVSSTSAAVCHYSADADLYSADWRPGSGGAVLGRVQETTPTRAHSLRIGTLSPDTSYTYRLRTSAGALLAEGTFTTPPPAGKRAVVFAAISDSGWPGGQEAAVAEAMRPARPEVVIHAGDVIYPHGEIGNYGPYFFEPFARVLDGAAFFPVVGNHDCETAGGQAWNDVFTTPANGPEGSERYYSFDWGDVHVLALDVVSTPYGRGSRQWAFADADLAAAAGSWKVVLMHYPPYSAGPSGGNNDVRRELVPVFEARRVDLVISGHDHGYQRFATRNGVRYLVTGGGGAPPDAIRSVPELACSKSCCHYLRARADATSLQLDAVEVTGEVIDTLSLKR